ncbi:MAG: sugar phosphate isomerase/epimerase family protein [Phycisphaerae bacterium]
MSKIQIGVFSYIQPDVPETIHRVSALGLTSCQVGSWQPDTWNPATAEALRSAADSDGVDISCFWTGWSGPRVWNFVDGPGTVGLVPPAYRERRTAELIAGAEFAASLGVPAICTHVGFLPEDPNDPNFIGTIDALKRVVDACERHGMEFWFETGQETPTTLLRAIKRLDSDRVGINLDTANLLLYGKANPLDALEMFGRLVRGVHVKDGYYPTDPDQLGEQCAIGTGKVDFPAIIERLKGMRFKGALTIEREISGEQQIADIREAVDYLRDFCT